MKKSLGILLLLAAGAAFATPSTLVSIPSTDIQAAKSWHFGSDVYLAKDGSSSLVDEGLTYGASKSVEVGIDLFSPAASPAAVNAKVLLTKPGAKLPVAAGVYNVGKAGSAFDQRIGYVVGSKWFNKGTERVTAGAYSAKQSAVGDDNSGVLVGAEYLDGKWWYGADYLSGDNALGSVNVGAAYSFAPNTSVIVGYDKFTADGLVDTYNVQVDVNF
jgi:hypothetical protein